jgi:hypothetical protein
MSEEMLSVRLEAYAKVASSRAHWAGVNGEADEGFWNAFAADLDAAAQLARRVEEARECEVVSIRATPALPVYQVSPQDGVGRPGMCGKRVRLVREG